MSRRAPGLAMLAGVVLFICVFTNAKRALGQEEAPADAPQGKVFVPFEGLEAFGHIIDSLKLRPVPRAEDLADLAPAQTLVIAFGNLASLDDIEQHVQSWDQFLKSGGALLIVSDEADGGRLKRFGVYLPTLKVQQDAGSSYKEIEDCPLLTQFVSGHPLFKNLDKGLATNRPAMVRPLPEADAPLTRLASYPADARLVLDARLKGIFGDRWLRVFPDAGYVFGSPKGAPPGGRVVVIAGHGAFINGMLMQDDSDNLNFARNLIGWLGEGPQGPRRHALFLVDGAPVTKFNLPISRPRALPVPPIQVVNQLLHGLEKENWFNRVLVDWLGKERIVRTLLVGATIALFMLAAWRLVRSRFRRDHAAPLLVGRTPESLGHMDATSKVALVNGVAPARLAALVAGDHFWEPAQALARQFFLDHAGAAPPLWQADAPPPPPTRVVGSWWERRTLQHGVADLWQVAASGPAETISRRRFQRLLVLIRTLAAAAHDRRLRFGER